MEVECVYHIKLNTLTMNYSIKMPYLWQRFKHIHWIQTTWTKPLLFLLL